MTHWLHEVGLTATAARARRGLSVAEFRTMQRAIEHLSLITERPIVEVADRMLCALQQMLGDADDTAGTDDLFLALLNDIAEEHER